MASDLALQQNSQLDKVRQWTNLHDDELKRKAAKAARDRDKETLLDLSLSYLHLHGSRSMKLSPNTLKTYKRGILTFLLWSEEQSFSLLSPDRHMSRLYLSYLTERYSPATTALYLTSARLLYEALNWSGASSKKPFESIKAPAERTTGLNKRPPYSEKEILEIIALADARLTFLMLLTLHAGLRISEALSLNTNNINTQKKELTIKGKGQKTRTVAMSQTLIEAWQEYALVKNTYRDGRASTQQTALFSFNNPTTARYHIEKLFIKAGIPFRGFHPARKYAGMKLLRQSRNLALVATHLGHASVETTRKSYADFETEDIKKEIENW